jgi:hypothetical protein
MACQIETEGCRLEPQRFGRRYNVLFRRLLFIGIVAASMAFSISFLTSRNLIDDELGSFLLTTKPISVIWKLANASDFHPPGMYIASHFFYAVTHSERWTTLGGLITLYIGLLAFYRATAHHFSSLSGRMLYSLLLFLHPQLLMWGNSVRWYPYWTGLALLFLTIGLGLSHSDKQSTAAPNVLSSFVLGAMGAALFYLSYTTLLFLTSFSAAYIVRYSGGRLRRLLIIATVFVTLVAPQLHAFLTVHLPKRDLQQYSMPVATIRLAHGIFASEALAPWHPVSLLFLILVVLPGLVFAARYLSGWKIISSPAEFRLNAERLSIFTLSATLFLLAGASGLGGKPRSFIILAPLLAFILAIGFQCRAPIQYRLFIVPVAVCWIVTGCIHLLLRTGTAKGGMNDHPEEMIQFISEQSKGACAIIFLHNPTLTYALNRVAHENTWNVVSIFGDPLKGIPSGAIHLKCLPTMEFVIKSFTGDSAEVIARLQRRLRTALECMTVDGEQMFGNDPDAAVKRQLPLLGDTGKSLPDYRFQVIYGNTKQQIDWTQIASSFSWDKPVTVSGLR